MKKKELTAEDVWAMFAEIGKTIEELRKRNKETSLQMQETDRRMQETDRRMQETDRMIKELSRRMGGIDENQGHHAEQFFQDVFKRKMEFGRVIYDEMIPNLTHNGREGKIEFDIALLNGDSIALIEVKKRIHPSFVKELAEERVEKFRKFFPEYKDYSAYLGIAGFSFCDEVLAQASRYGIGIVKQAGEGVEVKADNLRAY